MNGIMIETTIVKERKMQRYGNVEDLPQNVEEKINVLINKIEQITDHENISIYYGYPFIELDGQETIMKACIVSLSGIISIYTNDNEKNVYNRHLTKVLLDSSVLSEIYFSNPQNVLHNVMIDSVDQIMELLTDTDECFSIDNYREANAIIQNMYGLNHADERETSNESTMGALIKKRNNEINMLDENQFVTIYKKINAHTRIRGLAGSGKTILLVKKMAYMHYKNRNLELAYVFYTKSLKQYIKDLFFNFYRDFEKYKEPDMDKIHILHSWGGAEMEGFYSRTCKENGVARQGYSDVAGANKFDKVCFNLLDNLGGKGKKLYDYVFVDEAQDFSLGFFRLVLSTLKFNGKMIYAYDELQSLNDSVETIPGKQSIFQKEICEDINLSICYRSPKEIIVTAHALGLGIYKKNKEGKNDIVNMMQDYSIWKAIGYEELEGKLEYGERVRLGRKEVIEYKPEQCVEIIAKENEGAQYDSVSEEICRLIQNEDVLPEDILIIDLATMKLQDDFANFKKCFNDTVEWEDDNLNAKVHLVNKDSALKFKRKGSVPYTTIFRAKGNEANIVFIVNAHTMSSMMTFSRNRLFTAMTRAKFKVYVYGVCGNVMDTLKDEYEEVKKENFTLAFTYPTEKQLEKIRTIAKKEAKSADTFTRVFKDLKDDKELTIEILKEQTGARSIDELIGKLREYTENE